MLRLQIAQGTPPPNPMPVQIQGPLPLPVQVQAPLQVQIQSPLNKDPFNTGSNPFIPTGGEVIDPNVPNTYNIGDGATNHYGLQGQLLTGRIPKLYIPEYGDTDTGDVFPVAGGLYMGDYIEISVTNVGDAVGVLYTGSTSPQKLFPGQTAQWKMINVEDLMTEKLIWDATGTTFTFQTLKG